ncbi:unnamed protein product [Arctia plantaginis]|uniref:Uncharacterized protein n=1 Tax=Arctia plantaginis TaxID=874455 RepID=A0A8S1AZT0_ARCPL|nr:unnamed protein product [Arctia plantaginis]
MDKKCSQLSATWRRPSSKSKKRKFHGVLPHQSEADTSYASASAAKLKTSDDTSFDVHIDPTAGYSVIQFFLVFSALQQYLKCKVCNKDVSFTKYGQRGLGFKICVTCDCEEKYINSCPHDLNWVRNQSSFSVRYAFDWCWIEWYQYVLWAHETGTWNRRSSNASKETRSRRREAFLNEHNFYEESEGSLYGAGIAD